LVVCAPGLVIIRILIIIGVNLSKPTLAGLSYGLPYEGNYGIDY